MLNTFFKRNEILAIDLGRATMKAVVVRRQGRKVNILSAAEIEYTLDGKGNSSNPVMVMSEVLEKLGKYPMRVVLVSSEVKFLTSELPLPSEVKLSSDKLFEAVKWEAQAYLDFPASEGFLGYQLRKNIHPIRKEFSNGSDKNGKTTPVLITAMSKEAYNRLNNICERCHINLRSVYPNENIFTFSTNYFSEESVKIEQQYMSAVGAALQELKITGQGLLGINNRVPLAKKFKTRVYILPLLVTGLIALSLVGHYFYMKSSLWRYSSGIKRLKAEKSGFEKAISEWTELKSQIRNTGEEKRYFKEILPGRHTALINFLEGITDGIPDDLILDRILQEGVNTFIVEGSGLSAASITSFVTRLGNLEVVRETRLEAINEKETTDKNKFLFLYHFKIKVALEEK